MKSSQLKQRAAMVSRLPKHAEVIIFIDEGYSLPEEIIKLKKCHIIPVDQVGFKKTKDVVLPGEKETARS